MQKNRIDSVNFKHKVLNQIIRNLTDSDDVSVEVSMYEVMSDLPKQMIQIRIRKNADVVKCQRHPEFDEY